MKLLYGTTNHAKLEAMKRILSDLTDLEIIGLAELHALLPDIRETGENPLENARQKALIYYQAFEMPVFSCDSGLYFRDLPKELQPGVHVRRVRGKILTDAEMTDYYGGLAKIHGDIHARYQNAVCLILDAQHMYESMAKDLWGQPFLLTSMPHPRRQEGFPLDCLSIHPASGSYYYDLEVNQVDDVAGRDDQGMKHGFHAFFRDARDRFRQDGKRI